MPTKEQYEKQKLKKENIRLSELIENSLDKTRHLFGEIFDLQTFFDYHTIAKNSDDLCRISGKSLNKDELKYYKELSTTHAKYITDFYHLPKTKKIYEQFKELTTERKNEYYNCFRDCFDIMARSYNVDCFLIALEWNRNPEDCFYLPRRENFMNMETIDGEKVNIVADAQEYIDGKLDFCFVSMPQRCGKTTWGLFVHSLLIMKNLEKSIFGVGHSSTLVKHFYSLVLQLYSDNKTYRFFEIFSGHKLFKQNAEDYTIDIDKAHSFSNFTFRSIDGNITGSTEASLAAYLDDLIKEQNEIINPDIADKIWSKVNTLILGRMKNKVRLYGTATLWGENCPFTRLIEEIKKYIEIGYMKAERIRIRLFAWCNSKGESQFNYKYDLGFDTNYFKKIELSLGETDYALYSSMYLATPIPREGRPFEKVVFYKQNEILEKEKKGEKPFIFSATDVATATGGDYLANGYFKYFASSPDIIYFIDILYSKKGSDYTIPIIMRKHIEYKVERSELEEKEAKVDKKYNYGIAWEIKKVIDSSGIICHTDVHSASGLDSKISRIHAYEDVIKGIPNTRGYIIKFLHPEERTSHSDYNLAMKHLKIYSYKKNTKDDFPDMLSQALFYCLRIEPKKELKTYRIKF